MNLTGPISASDVAELLDWSKGSGGGWIGRCPSHDDRHASLTISTGRKGTVLNCHAGCRTEDICAALGFGVEQLFDDYEPGGNGHDTSATMLLREFVNNIGPYKERLENPTLYQIMDRAFSGTVGDMVSAHLFAGDWLFLDFEEAWKMYHITADLAVYPYMERYVKASQRNWHEVKREAMTKLFTTWKDVRVV